MADVGSTVTNPASCHKSEYRLVDCSQIRDKFEETGQVRKKDYPAEKALGKLNEPAQFFILYLVLERPGIYLREIRSGNPLLHDLKAPRPLPVCSVLSFGLFRLPCSPSGPGAFPTAAEHHSSNAHAHSALFVLRLARSQKIAVFIIYTSRRMHGIFGERKRA